MKSVTVLSLYSDCISQTLTEYGVWILFNHTVRPLPGPIRDGIVTMKRLVAVSLET